MGFLEAAIGPTHSCLPSLQKLSPLLQGLTEHRARAELRISKPGIVTWTGICFDFPYYARLNSCYMSSKTVPCKTGRVGTRWQELLRLSPGWLSPLLKSQPEWLYISVMLWLTTVLVVLPTLVLWFKSGLVSLANKFIKADDPTVSGIYSVYQNSNIQTWKTSDFFCGRGEIIH